MSSSGKSSGGASAFVGAKVNQTGFISLPPTTITALPFNANDYDTSSIHSTTVNNTRFTVPAGMGGKWQFGCLLAFNSSNVSTLALLLTKNGGGAPEYVQVSNVSPNLTLELITQLSLAAGDYIEFSANNNSGATLLTAANGLKAFVNFLGT